MCEKSVIYVKYSDWARFWGVRVLLYDVLCYIALYKSFEHHRRKIPITMGFVGLLELSCVKFCFT